MNNILEEIKKHKNLWFEIDEDSKVEFLKVTKAISAKWINGKEIFPETDICGHFMGIDDSLTIGYVSPLCFFKAKNKPKIIKFKR